MNVNVVKEVINKFYENEKYSLKITYKNLDTKYINHNYGFEVSIYYDSLRVITPNGEIYYYDISNIVRIMLVIL